MSIIVAIVTSVYCVVIGLHADAVISVDRSLVIPVTDISSRLDKLSLNSLSNFAIYIYMLTGYCVVIHAGLQYRPILCLCVIWPVNVVSYEQIRVTVLSYL